MLVNVTPQTRIETLYNHITNYWYSLIVNLLFIRLFKSKDDHCEWNVSFKYYDHVFRII